MESCLLIGLGLPIHRHHLCRARHYCHEVEPFAEALHAQVEQLVQQAGNQADASVALYYFNASLYLLRVLKGNTTKSQQDDQNLQGADTMPEPSDSKVSQGPAQAISSECLRSALAQDLLPVSPQLCHQDQPASCLNLAFVTRVYSEALKSLLTKRNSPLTVPMFLSLFSRYPVSAGASLPLGNPSYPSPIS